MPYIIYTYLRAQRACPPPCLKTSSSSYGQHLRGVCPGPMCCIVELSRVADCRPSLPVVVSKETTSFHEDTCWILAACYNLMGCFMECFSGHYTLLSLCLSPTPQKTSREGRRHHQFLEKEMFYLCRESLRTLLRRCLMRGVTTANFLRGVRTGAR